MAGGSAVARCYLVSARRPTLTVIVSATNRLPTLSSCQAAIGASSRPVEEVDTTTEEILSLRAPENTTVLACSCRPDRSDCTADGEGLSCVRVYKPSVAGQCW